MYLVRQINNAGEIVQEILTATKEQAVIARAELQREFFNNMPITWQLTVNVIFSIEEVKEINRNQRRVIVAA